MTSDTSISSADLPRHRALWLLAGTVLLVGLPLRCIVISRAAMISRDGVTFIWYAQRLAENPLAEMRAQHQHPLYPAMLLAAHSMWPGLSDDALGRQTAAMGVALLGGLAVIAGVYALGAVVFDRRIGLAAAGLAAVTAEFCQLSADALSDMPHLSLYLFGLAAGIHGLRKPSSGWLFIAGALSGAAYWMRPEGAEVALVIGAMIAWRAARNGLKSAIRPAIALICGAALVACPYMFITGKLVQKKPIEQFIPGLADEPSAVTGMSDEVYHTASSSHMTADMTDVPAGIGKLTENWARSLRYSLLLPALGWLVLRNRFANGSTSGDPIGRRTAGSAVAVHLFILMALVVRFDYLNLLSVRHSMVLAGLTLPFSAAGLVMLYENLPKLRRQSVIVIVVMLLVVPTTPWLFEARHADDVALRKAAEWIREHDDAERPRICTSRHRVVFYADGEWVFSSRGSDALWILGKARKADAHWLIFEEDRMLKMSSTFFDDLESAVKPGDLLERAQTIEHVYKGNTRRVRIYRLSTDI